MKTATDETSRATHLGRIEEIRGEFARVHDTYVGQSERALSRLEQIAAASGDPEVKKAAKSVAEDYDLTLKVAAMKQPPTPKRHSPFAD